MSNGNEETQPEPEPDPDACQKCGKVDRYAMRLGKIQEGITFMACLCADCFVESLGLEWRKARPRSVIVAGPRFSDHSERTH